MKIIEGMEKYVLSVITISYLKVKVRDISEKKNESQERVLILVISFFFILPVLFPLWNS